MAPVLVTALLLSAFLSEEASSISRVDLFVIERNKNKNLVQYSVRLDAACAPVGDEPLEAFWRMLEVGPEATEEVGLFERSAYGIADQECRADGVTVQLKALPQRAVTIRAGREGGQCRAGAYMRINGAEARLARVYAHADDTTLIPSVAYIDLFGQTADGRAVTERLVSD